MRRLGYEEAQGRLGKSWALKESGQEGPEGPVPTGGWSGTGGYGEGSTMHNPVRSTYGRYLTIADPLESTLT